MRVIKISSYILLFAFLTNSCKKDFLERAPGVNLSLDQVFADPILAEQFGDNSYQFRVADYMRWGTSNDRCSTSHISDEGVAQGDAMAGVLPFYQGLYHTTENEIGVVWDNCYKGIRNCNIMISRISKVPWTTNQDSSRIKGEQYFLRAFYYAELIKRFGNVPLFNKALEMTDEIDIPRSSYQECINFILSDLTIAESLLPLAYNAVSGPNTAASYGRTTSGTAKALRSRVLLYAASPRDNTTNDKSKWAAAAAASKAVMDMNLYSLQANYSTIINVSQSTEFIQIKVRGPRARLFTYLQDAMLSPGSGGDQGTMNPSQNHVDLYEMQATGKPITDATSGYDALNPYVGRDPRFYANVLYNDVPWEGRRMQMWDGGLDYKEGNVIYTATRYYNRKWWPEVFYVGSSATTFVNFIYFRYAEILLNYAEAQNEAVGPDISVYNAINQIRTRAVMPSLPAGLTQAQMRDRIRNERAVELAFEDHRWYDIMRWKIGVQTIAQPIKGMKVIKNANGTFGYSVITLASSYQRTYEEKQNFYPIPRREVQKSKGNLTQNPGWE